jgi:hypothetical protein
MNKPSNIQVIQLINRHLDLINSHFRSPLTGRDTIFLLELERSLIQLKAYFEVEQQNECGAGIAHCSCGVGIALKKRAS